MTCAVGLVILTYGDEAGASAERLVRELSRDGVDADCIILVHNWSPGAPQLEDAPARAQLINAKANLGYAAGMNLGLRDHLARGRPLILLLTQDVHFEPGAIANMVAAAGRVPRYGILGPRLQWHGRHTVTSYGGRWSSTGRSELIVNQPPDTDDDGITASDYVDGSALLVRREVLERVGLLNERFFMYFEEAELCLRAKRAGWDVGVVHAARASQVSGEQKRPGPFNYMMARNGLEFARMVGGRRGQVAALGRDVRQSYLLTRMLVSHKSDGRRRAAAAAGLTAIWMGVWAYARGRWGAPPARLPGMGDVAV
jgi:GT2 family glycosyltransferase